MMLVGNSTMMAPMQMQCSVLPAPAIWASMWCISTCTKHVALPMVEVDQALARLVSKNTSYHSCLVHCLLKGTMVITGLIKDQSLLGKLAPTMATLAALCGLTPTFARVAVWCSGGW